MDDEITERLGVRFKPKQLALLREAAEKAGYRALADYVRDAVGTVIEEQLEKPWPEGPRHGGFRPSSDASAQRRS